MVVHGPAPDDELAVQQAQRGPLELVDERHARAADHRLMAAVEARAVVDVVVAADQHGRHVELGEHVESGLHHVLRHPAVVEEVADDQSRSGRCCSARSAMPRIGHRQS